MKAQETTLQQLIQGEKQFLVPLYQRPFSWGEQQLVQLWADIRELADRLANGDLRTPHFIGSIVLAPSPDLQAAGVQRWIVVDGQQRLTTLMLLLCAIRDHVSPSAPEQRDRFDELYLTNKWKTGDDHFRLLPTQHDRPAFVACIRQTPDAGSGDGIGAAYRFFRRMLVEADDPADPHDIDRIETVVRELLSIVEVSADRDDNVYRIFESLNNTGLRLSQADLVRNYIFMRLPTRDQEVYDTLWLPIQEALKGDQLELLMYLDLVLRGDERARREDLYRGHQERLRELDEDAVVDYTRELARRSTFLQTILNPEGEDDEEVRESLERLRAWGAQVVYPPIMALYERRHHGDATGADVAECLLFIESFVVRRMLNAVYTGNLNRIFQALTGEILSAQDVAAATRTTLSGTRLYWPTDDELRDAIRNRPFYWQGRSNQRVFVLRRLEETFPSAERADLASATLTIEHVLPQTFTPEWLAAVEAETPEGEDPVDLANRLVHTLGNLTLTGYNSELSNSPFADKRERLKESNLEMNRPIAAKDKWGPTEILERADDLANRATIVWPGPDESVRDAAQGRDWELLHQALAALPAGSWTSYSDLAELVGSHPVPVGVHIARTPSVINGHRAMSHDGRISENFRWHDPEDDRDPRAVLEEEGVRFLEGRADAAQRVTGPELAALVGLGDDIGAIEHHADIPVVELGERHQRFLEQLTERDGPAASGAIARILDKWTGAGGELSFGSSATTSCFLVIRGDEAAAIWPLGIYPGSTIEVAFQQMKSRPPFDDPALRGEFRRLLNQASDIDIPLAKLELRPSFPIAALLDPTTEEVVSNSLEWFVGVVRQQPEYAPRVESPMPASELTPA